MPNYKICRFCPEKFVPIADEKICPKCKDAILNAVKTAPFGEPILAGTISDPVIDAMKKAVADANPKSITEEKVEAIAEAIAPIIEKIAEPVAKLIKEGIVSEEVAKIIGVPPEVPEAVIPIIAPETPEIAVVKEALEELDKGDEALIVKEDIIAPAAPKPEEKPDAQS